MYEIKIFFGVYGKMFRVKINLKNLSTLKQAVKRMYLHVIPAHCVE